MYNIIKRVDESKKEFFTVKPGSMLAKCKKFIDWDKLRANNANSSRRSSTANQDNQKHGLTPDRKIDRNVRFKGKK